MNNKPGRPKKAPNEYPKASRVGARVTHIVKSHLKDLSRKKHKTMSETLQDCIEFAYNYMVGTETDKIRMNRLSYEDDDDGWIR